MTPIEAAAKAVGRVELWDGARTGNVFTEDECRQVAFAAITVFLEAVAGDERLLDTMCEAARSQFCEMHDGGAKAAILSLKEAMR